VAQRVKHHILSVLHIHYSIHQGAFHALQARDLWWEVTKFGKRIRVRLLIVVGILACDNFTALKAHYLQRCSLWVNVRLLLRDYETKCQVYWQQMPVRYSQPTI
jgi:hypothetical protein